MITKSRFNADHPPICRRHQISCCFPINWWYLARNKSTIWTKRTKRKRVYAISSTWKTWIFQTNRIITKSSHFHTLLETISNCVQIIQFSEKLNKIENFDFRAKNEWFLIWFFTVKKSKFNTFNYGWFCTFIKW